MSLGLFSEAFTLDYEGDKSAPKRPLEDSTDNPEPKKARMSTPPPTPTPTISFQHPVSELVSKYHGAVFNFKGLCHCGSGRRGEISVHA